MLTPESLQAFSTLKLKSRQSSGSFANNGLKTLISVIVIINPIINIINI